MSSRNRSIHSKIVFILLVPLVSLIAFWALAVYVAIDHMLQVGLGSPVGVAGRGGQVFEALTPLVLVGALGLVAVTASIVVAVRVGRQVVREMRGLSAGTRDFAERRLPMIAERLRRGEATDGDFDAPSYTFTTTETVELLESFVTARRAAVQATVQEAAVRQGIGDVFLNLARRNQALLHRQLGLLDTMERQVTEPDELNDLFHLDQLATRMRRHAEGLVILSGAAPGRGWRQPVPLVDVVRAAVSEVEDYSRVTVLPVPQDALSGPAVADVIHLLAELVENATLFSPPHTGVRVSSQLVGNGFAVEIEDRGLGMTSEDMATANEMLATTPEFDLSDSTRLGFFVVSRLARRHDIQVSLRPSPFGGTTAIVLIPWSVVVQNQDAGEHSAPEAHSGGGEAQTASPREGPKHAAPPDAAVPEPLQLARVSPDAAGQDTATAAESGLDLPRRTRQVSLAPQLRDTPQESADEAGEEMEADGRPERTRTTMASIQQGWSRGRSESEPAADVGSDPAEPAGQSTEGQDR